jgi:hypothetical protein
MRVVIIIATLSFLVPAVSFSQQKDTAAEIRELREKLERLERKMAEEESARTKKAEEERATIAEKVKSDVISEVSAKGRTLFGDILGQTKVGAYGSMRYGTSNLDDVHNTFTFRRFVLTLDSAFAERLRGYLELELERFTQLELEKRTFPDSGGLKTEFAVEGSNETEIALEQAWVQYSIAPWLNFRAGGVLVPLGRFNINHDDNRWDLARRSLVDRGVPVLPAKSAWPELGAGFLGDFSLGRQGKLSYEWYVMNGVVLDSELETIVQTHSGARDKLEGEVVLRPARGTFSDDLKSGKAIGTRWAYSPWLGDEIAASLYWGRYTPDFLADQNVISFAFDGKKTWGAFEIEGQYVNSTWSGVNNVAKSFARAALEQSRAIPAAASPDFEAEIEFELSQLAKRKQGYWVDFRYRFWPEFLSNTFLGRRFSNPQLITTLRWEQAWLQDLIREIDFAEGVLTELKKESRLVNRATLGFTYRPVPLAGFTIAYEYTRTNSGKSLSSVTNFLASAKERENFQHAVLFGLSFGF